MSPLPPILYFGNDWFADNRTSSHHVARQLSRYTRILYVEAPGLRAPQATSRDIKRLGAKLVRACSRAEVSPSLAVRTLPQLPLHSSATARSLNAAVSRVFVSRSLRGEGMSKPIVWCTIPHVANVAERVRSRSLLVYHCIDDYSALPGVDVAAVRAYDEQLTRSADVVIAASVPVFEAKRRQNPAAILLPHGVDVDHFARARTSELAEPAELRDLPRPLVGFFGLIERWIDLELVDWLAQRLPEVTFVLIGRLAVGREAAPKAANVVLLGPRPYESLPAYGRAFSVGIIPYRLTDQVIAANPLKLREYLAMGLPVVSVSTPEIDKFADVVNIARSPEEFLAQLRRALAEREPDGAARARMAAVREHSWESRVDSLVDHIRETLDKGGRASRTPWQVPA
jgi:glycosyltransferase involved in cell wall biosynthesis